MKTKLEQFIEYYDLICEISGEKTEGWGVAIYEKSTTYIKFINKKCLNEAIEGAINEWQEKNQNRTEDIFKFNGV